MKRLSSRDVWGGAILTMSLSISGCSKSTEEPPARTPDPLNATTSNKVVTEQKPSAAESAQPKSPNASE